MTTASPSSAPSEAQDAPHLGERNIHHIPNILPRERVFPIQIGTELFKLSGASLSSDAPSYFSQYFLCQIRNAEEEGEDVGAAIRTLYIDRDPETFRDIALHLQGYHISPRDGKHFVKLFADAQFYALPKLISQLYEESIFISIGHREFQIPRDLLKKSDNCPNYFSLGFAFFFSQPENLFPGLDREGLLRPPSILPPSVPNRNADTFADLLRLLRGYPVHVRDETHRAELLRDARYFHFKGIEQKLIPHSITFNPVREVDEIVLMLENVQKSGISVTTDAGQPEVYYARPHVDDRPAQLVLEMGGSSTRIHFEDGRPRAEFFRDTKARVAKLLEVISTKLNLPPTTQPLGLLMAQGGATSQPATPGHTPLSEDLVRVSLSPEADIVLDGEQYLPPSDAATNGEDAALKTASRISPRKRRRTNDHDDVMSEPWTVLQGQWRLKIQPSLGGKSSMECIFEAVKLQAVSSERGRNQARGFLSP